jgi:hypothetical protein
MLHPQVPLYPQGSSLQGRQTTWCTLGTVLRPPWPPPLNTVSKDCLWREIKGTSPPPPSSLEHLVLHQEGVLLAPAGQPGLSELPSFQGFQIRNLWGVQRGDD